jgi:hypothetical protein
MHSNDIEHMQVIMRGNHKSQKIISLLNSRGNPSDPLSISTPCQI